MVKKKFDNLCLVKIEILNLNISFTDLINN
jgi:hypothetical protein